MWIDFEQVGRAQLKARVLIVAVSTSMPQYRALYSQAREMGEYMLRKMKFEKLGTVRASAFPPEVLIRGEGVSTLPECSLYRLRGKHDVMLFAGDTSPMDEQHEFAQFLLEKAKRMGVKDLYSVGVRWAENPLPPEAEPQATGFSTDSVGVARLKKHGVKVLGEEPAPFFASMIVAMAKTYGIRGFKLAVDHGEPSPHTRSVIKLLDILGAMAGFEVDLSELKSKALPSAPPRQTGNNQIYH
ncbi:MAG: PAC2 family protein [Nitrososphaerota archaeon]|nr:PAC2 family protein [Nitrososphaerota archaeon]